ncbi:DUF523 domain-containing protein [Orenia marismortui]|uniref:DUF523 domain-containing protein n=1 Tax=Orenia marismortui TaxID=46469 RepID=UPI000382CE2F|nr:DUF523 domain-containing protein [Orenia marismortui]
MYLVSACLAGINCRYNGGNSKNLSVSKLVKEGKALPVCPEVLGGLKTPRSSCEIIIDESKNKRVISKDGRDFSKEFIVGAEKTLEIAQIIGAEVAILQSRSPSCGYGLIYDGNFSGELIKGNGLTADLLIKNDIIVYSDTLATSF